MKSKTVLVYFSMSILALFIGGAFGFMEFRAIKIAEYEARYSTKETIQLLQNSGFESFPEIGKVKASYEYKEDYYEGTTLLLDNNAVVSLNTKIEIVKSGVTVRRGTYENFSFVCLGDSVIICGVESAYQPSVVF